MTPRPGCPSGPSDARRALIEPVLAARRKARTGRRPTGKAAPAGLRDIFNAILYVNRTGIAWKYLPRDFPPDGTACSCYAAWRDEGTFARLGCGPGGLARVKEGRGPGPAAAVIGTQAVKTSASVPLASQGTDAGKKIAGRERGVITGAPGLIPAVAVTAAGLSGNAIGTRLLGQAKNAYPTISRARAGTGFKNAAVEHGAATGIDVEIVPRNTQARGFHVVKRRWVVERGLGRLMLHRRLARDETPGSSSEATIRIASIDNLTRRITDETTPTWRGTY